VTARKISFSCEKSLIENNYYYDISIIEKHFNSQQNFMGTFKNSRQNYSIE